MQNKNILFVAICLFSITSFAATSSEKKMFSAIKQGDKKVNILNEASKISLQGEPTVQETTAPSDLFISLRAGALGTNTLTTSTKAAKTKYSFEKPMNTFGFELSNYMFGSSLGKWGWSVAGDYSYTEYSFVGKQTALHILPVGVSAALRGNPWQSNHNLRTLVSAGPTLLTYIQRGVEELNTSGAQWLLQASAGIEWLPEQQRRNPISAYVKATHYFALDTSTSDLSGNAIHLGGMISL